MSRIIIDNQSEMTDDEVLKYAGIVIREGRISDSGKSYCFATRFVDGTEVYVWRNKASDRFVIRGSAA